MTPPFSPSSSLASAILFADLKKNGAMEHIDSGTFSFEIKLKANLFFKVNYLSMQAYHLRLFALQLRKKDEDPENLLV
jgi:hypothetical protein